MGGVIVMSDEVETTFRQIFIDGRKLPAIRHPPGTGHSEDMRVEERFRRRDYGHIGSHHHRPSDLHQADHFQRRRGTLPDTDLLERYCAENERDDAHMPGRERKQ